MTVGAEKAYIAQPIAERASDELHSSARELIGRHSLTGGILDLGCSDGVSTWGMTDVRVIGVDLNQEALRQAAIHTPGYQGVAADIRDLPFTPEDVAGIDTVLALEVLEHEKWDDSVKVLEQLRTLLPADHTLIASMPVVSALSFETYREFMQVIKSGRRPDTGLFDKTHHILTSMRGHRRLLQEGGYQIIDSFQTNRLEGVTGSWKWKDEARIGTVAERAARKGRSKLVVGMAGAANNLYSSLNDSKYPIAREFGRSLFAYQGIYVAKPTT